MLEETLTAEAMYNQWVNDVVQHYAETHSVRIPKPLTEEEIKQTIHDLIYAK